jgi:hypothetical protein
VGEPARAVTAFDQTLAIVRELGDPAGQANVLRGLGGARLQPGELGAARAALKRARELATAAGEQMAEAQALLGLSELALASDDPQLASALAQQASGACREIGAPLYGERTQSLLASAHAALGDGSGAPQDVRPGGQHVAGQGAGQEVPAGQHQHPGAEAWQQVQGLLPGGVRAERRPGQRAGPGLRRGDPPHLRARPVPGRSRGPAEERDVSSLSGRLVVEPSTEITRSPQQNTPSAPSGPATCSNSMCSGSAPSFPRARDSEEMFGGRHRRTCPASTQPAGSSCPASRSVPRRR